MKHPVLAFEKVTFWLLNFAYRGIIRIPSTRGYGNCPRKIITILVSEIAEFRFAGNEPIHDKIITDITSFDTTLPIIRETLSLILAFGEKSEHLH